MWLSHKRIYNNAHLVLLNGDRLLQLNTQVLYYISWLSSLFFTSVNQSNYTIPDPDCTVSTVNKCKQHIINLKMIVKLH